MAKKLFQRLAPDAAVLKQHRSMRWLGNSLEDPNIWHLNRQSVARAFLIGLIVAFLPIPMQMVVAGAAAFWFRANLPIAASLVWITNPLTFAPMYYAAYRIGALLIGEPALPISFEPTTTEQLLAQASQIWQPLLLGCVVAGVSCGLIAYAAVSWVWRWQVINRWEERKQLRQKKSVTA